MAEVAGRGRPVAGYMDGSGVLYQNKNQYVWFYLGSWAGEGWSDSPRNLRNSNWWRHPVAKMLNDVDNYDVELGVCRYTTLWALLRRAQMP